MNLYSVLSVLCIILWICALISCIKSNNSSKLIWIIVIIFVPLLGAILYFLMGRGKD